MKFSNTDTKVLKGKYLEFVRYLASLYKFVLKIFSSEVAFVIARLP